MVSGTGFTLLPLQCIQEKTVDGTTRDRFQILERVGGGSFGVTHKVNFKFKKKIGKFWFQKNSKSF